MSLEDIIGEGQFGDVHKGVYRVPPSGINGNDCTNNSSDQLHQVAVKTCKVDDDAMAEKFLEEACECIECVEASFVANGYTQNSYSGIPFYSLRLSSVELMHSVQLSRVCEYPLSRVLSIYSYILLS